MRRETWTGVAMAVAVLLAGCGPSAHVTVGDSSGSFTVSGDKVVLHGDGGATAEVAPDGSFVVDGKPVAVSDAQRASLQSYHSTAMQLIDHAKDTGKAGAAVGVAAVEAVAKGLTSGDTSKIGENIEAKVGPVKEAAGKLCDDLGKLAGLQTVLASDLADFKRFQVISAEEPSKCRKDLDKHPAE